MHKYCFGETYKIAILTVSSSYREHFMPAVVKLSRLRFGEKMKKLVIGLLTLLVLAACAGGTSASIIGQWSLVSYGSASNQVPAAPDVDTSIEFGADGQLSGNVGCNGFGGEYTVDGDTITFSPITSTMMFCEGPVGEQETGTITVFQESATFVLDGDTLTITSADGNSVIVLARK